MADRSYGVNGSSPARNECRDSEAHRFLVGWRAVAGNKVFLGRGVSAFTKATARQPESLRELEARGIEPLSSSPPAQTSTCLSGEQF
jgi:hypothetical protein